MRDPLDELDHFTTPGPTVDPLPAAEVRRRGTRLRRRNHALTTVGTIAAVTLIATPLTLAANRPSSSDPQPVDPAPSVSWVQQIPSGFPLTDGLPRATTQDPYRAEADADVCDGLGWSPDGPPAAIDVQQVVQTENEGGLDRALAVYADDDAAAQARLDLEARAQDCATATDGRARSTEVVSTTTRSLVYVDHVSDAGEMFTHRVVQVGNALLLDTVYSLGGGDPAIVQRTAELLETKSAPVVAAMEDAFSSGTDHRAGR